MLGIVLLGAPGAGKGTQAQFIGEYCQIALISTGEILRQAIKSGSDLGGKVKAIVESGALVSDDIILDLVKQRIKQPDCRNGYLFDGFPRTLAQADGLGSIGVKINYVFEIDVSSEEVVKRLSGRRVHLASGRTYHLIYNPPKVANLDDITGEALIQRDDDKEDTIIHRLEVYAKQTKPLIEYYSTKDEICYVKIDGAQDVDRIKQKILNSIK